MKRRNRESGTELFRIFFAIGVIVLHYNNKKIGGALLFVEPNSFNYYWIFLTESVFIAAVDFFICVSGYYSCNNKKSKTIKALSLLIQVMFVRELTYIIDVVMGGAALSIKDLVANLLPVNSFAILFSALYIVSPFINCLLNSLNKKQIRRMTILLFIIFSVSTLIIDYLNVFTSSEYGSLSTISYRGSLNGYTIVNYVLLYIIGASIRLLNIDIRKFKCIIACAVGIVMIFSEALVDTAMGISPVVWHYNNFIVIGFTFFMVCLATRINIKSRIINELAGACLMSMLLNNYLLSFFDIKKAVTNSIFYLIGHQLLVVIVIYICSYLLYKVWSALWGVFVKVTKINVALEKLDCLIYEGFDRENSKSKKV